MLRSSVYGFNNFMTKSACNFCGTEYDSKYLKDVHHNFEHDDLCDLYKAVCPKKCSETNAVIWKRHRSICTEKSIKCPFYHMGCDSSGLKENNMSKHLFEDGFKHTEILLKHIDNLNNELTSVKIQLENVKKLIPGGEINDSIRDMSNAISKLNLDVTAIQINQVESAEKLRDSEEKLRISTGVCFWKIRSFNTVRNFKRIYSSPFYTHHRGYRMQLELRKVFSRSNGNDISIYAKLVMGEYDDELPWPCNRMVTIVLVDQERRNRDFTNTIDFDGSDSRSDQPRALYGGCIGFDTFIDENQMDCRPYLLLTGDLWINCFVSDLDD